MKRISCDCIECKNACKFKPGWFKFGEIEKVAEYMKISVKELFNNYLAVDWYEKSYNIKNTIFVISPVVKGNIPGEMFPFNPKGICIFFNEKNGKCDIHKVSPFECQQYIHEEDEEIIEKRHIKTALTWKNKKDYITNLLEYEPYESENDGSLSILNLF